MNKIREQVMLKFCKLHKDAIIPTFGSEEAAGFDFYALESYKIPAGQSAFIRTGLCMEIEAGYEIQVRSRSGLALKHRIMVLNSPGTVDSDYRGELMVILANFGDDFEIKQGDRIAQGIVQKLPQVKIVEVEAVNTTKRGIGGFGSTGI
ncbi:dUTP diphosphatase [Helicobacter didelphidarum]|uniref:dUTP diphosphatase n=1 Tax=Helicobacter didelphidarum TaxID=2040648 RepID=A0A3D8ILS1_9HELI|nr:dUTP diphosphatase [Helicobacter didelphidarum]RDU65905.1 dUTP diphosphatase [Helicobacter didelphidarum]